MLRNWNVFALLVGIVLVGCGGTEVNPSPEEVGTTTGALVTCSASCSNGGSVSCQGTTCSASDFSYVQCDGNYQYCPTSSTCEYTNSCEYLLGQACAPKTQRTCCDGYGSDYTCHCYQGKWMCPL